MKKFNIKSLTLLIVLLPLIVNANNIDSHLLEQNDIAKYVAQSDTVGAFFERFSALLNYPIVVSKQAAKKRISGEFDLSNPEEMLEKLTLLVGLIWYKDGNALYIYDSGELISKVILLENISLNYLIQYLKDANLYDHRYPIRGNISDKTFYISGPPALVELVANTATLLDKQVSSIGTDKVNFGVIKLKNTFVSDRTYNMRGEDIVIPGVATVVERLLNNGKALSNRKAQNDQMPPFNITQKVSEDSNDFSFSSVTNSSILEDVSLIAYPETNSILVKGNDQQIQIIRDIITQLDVAKRHIELSLWIIDIDKSELNNLGVNWQGTASFGDSFGASFNMSSSASISTLDGNKFIASVMALNQKKKANVVSRPVILTQENIPAIFDNNRTFYVSLVGERNSSLEHVTYGTLINVIPRFSSRGQIEMSLTIEDGTGNSQSNYNYNNENTSVLPEVGRTKISTIARVPQGKSLLIGGYTHETNSNEIVSIPFLSSIPVIGNVFKYKTSNISNIVRVFLIQPREIKESSYYNTAEYKSLISEREIQKTTQIIPSETTLLEDEKSLVSYLNY
ncbi:EscC/YscC/HrcC family type III secretion system outer membrane ring protein [Shigella flexneri]|uniref:type III secretion system secretin MxiD n=1 Tax=Shigella flexneri TaxID=623 RepID=UPI0019A1E63B|nr:type III secretion system secretin MxiD [Shigella flexneri]EFW9294506.1 EscC/YscC/HrcC family type III secretion system outer membrane ring protein [Shigella flexneri]EFX2138361.1 EscC/YscC/HrcC family type III secretion system outer membrane ring protein [Shigella flexneri]EFY6015289.1 type III secretion system secretin MxiD [Shigella flexneri]WNE50343.1 type III secretion system secretin MxiD [Shigella flexneri]HAY5392479.1 type III secretion system secretin MxiD [Shigella flexneri]